MFFFAKFSQIPLTKCACNILIYYSTSIGELLVLLMFKTSHPGVKPMYEILKVLTSFQRTPLLLKVILV